MSSTTLQHYTAACADTYRLLSACYYEPNKEMFADEDVFAQLFASLNRCLPGKAYLAQDLDAAMAGASQDELLIEYARLFVGPQELLAHPYGSVYLDGAKILMGDSTMDVIQRYREADFAINPDLKEVPDHIAFELEFLYLLCHNEAVAEAEQRCDDAADWSKRRERFLQDHIGRWITFFCDKVRASGTNTYYSLLAELTQSFVLSQSQKTG